MLELGVPATPGRVRAPQRVNALACPICNSAENVQHCAQCLISVHRTCMQTLGLPLSERLLCHRIPFVGPRLNDTYKLRSVHSSVRINQVPHYGS